MTYEDHYIECRDVDCLGCLPDDDSVRVMKMGAARRELRLRDLSSMPMQTVDTVLADADDYRTRSAAARALLFP